MIKLITKFRKLRAERKLMRIALPIAAAIMNAREMDQNTRQSDLDIETVSSDAILVAQDLIEKVKLAS